VACQERGGSQLCREVHVSAGKHDKVGTRRREGIGSREISIMRVGGDEGVGGRHAKQDHTIKYYPSRSFPLRSSPLSSFTFKSSHPHLLSHHPPSLLSSFIAASARRFLTTCHRRFLSPLVTRRPESCLTRKREKREYAMMRTSGVSVMFVLAHITQGRMLLEGATTPKIY
jgi:hypothetical protein